jgi:hypothetical protein
MYTMFIIIMYVIISRLILILCIIVCEQRIVLSMDIDKFHLELDVNIFISSGTAVFNLKV